LGKESLIQELPCVDGLLTDFIIAMVEQPTVLRLSIEIGCTDTSFNAPTFKNPFNEIPKHAMAQDPSKQLEEVSLFLRDVN